MPATLLERKGHNVLLQAASLASESDLSLTIVFVGSSTELLRGDIIPSSQYEINLLELRREALSLGVQVDAHGHVDDQSYAQLLESVDLVAFPTLYEGYGLPLSEAVMAGIPVIASDLPPIREQLELYDIADRVILVKPNDATELARALLSFAHENLPKRVRPSTLSSNFKRWTWAMAADKVYSTLLNSLA
jgi:glycosyltransferase involved in cell wall biosynthesis